MFLADALIRAYLHVDPMTLTDDEWAHQLTMAEWIRGDMTQRRML